MRAGKILEPAIANLAQDMSEFIFKKCTWFLADDEHRLGGTPDFYVTDTSRGGFQGTGIADTKNVDWKVFQDWDREPPLHHELQLQTYLGLDNRKWGLLVYLVGGNEIQIFTREFRPKLFAEIETRARAFWDRVESETPPDADFEVDADVIATLHREMGRGAILDLGDDNYTNDLAARYLDAQRRKTEAEKEQKAVKAELFTKLDDAEQARCRNFWITARSVAGNPGKEITPDMVGQRINPRSPYRRLTIKAIDDEKEISNGTTNSHATGPDHDKARAAAG
jgi:predicted phage-related endonuclease